MHLNNAQRLYTQFLGVDPDFFNHQTAKVAVEQTRELLAFTKAPHAPRSTPPRPHFPRKAAKRAQRLFKGHRA